MLDEQLLAYPTRKIGDLSRQVCRHFVKRYGFDFSTHATKQEAIVLSMYVCMYVINTTTTTTTTTTGPSEGGVNGL